MSHNMSIYRRLNPRLLVQVGLSLDLLYWANMSNIYIYISNTFQAACNHENMASNVLSVLFYASPFASTLAYTTWYNTSRC